MKVDMPLNKESKPRDTVQFELNSQIGIITIH